jgi:tetratricopeptide (TPR) repeat protein
LRFCRPIHEHILPEVYAPQVHRQLAHIRIEHHGYASDELYRAKLRRNLAILHRYHDEHPEDVSTVYDLGRTYAGLGEWREAKDYLTRFLSVRHLAHDLSGRAAYRLLIDLEWSHGDRKEAMRIAQEGCREFPHDSHLVSAAASMLAQIGELQLAEEGFRRARALFDPQHMNVGVSSSYGASLDAAINHLTDLRRDAAQPAREGQTIHV